MAKESRVSTCCQNVTTTKSYIHLGTILANPSWKTPFTHCLLLDTNISITAFTSSDLVSVVPSAISSVDIMDNRGFAGMPL